MGNGLLGAVGKLFGKDKEQSNNDYLDMYLHDKYTDLYDDDVYDDDDYDDDDYDDDYDEDDDDDLFCTGSLMQSSSYRRTMAAHANEFGGEKLLDKFTQLYRQLSESKNKETIINFLTDIDRQPSKRDKQIVFNFFGVQYVDLNESFDMQETIQLLRDLMIICGIIRERNKMDPEDSKVMEDYNRLKDYIQTLPYQPRVRMCALELMGYGYKPREDKSRSHKETFRTKMKQFNGNKTLLEIFCDSNCDISIELVFNNGKRMWYDIPQLSSDKYFIDDCENTAQKIMHGIASREVTYDKQKIRVKKYNGKSGLTDYKEAGPERAMNFIQDLDTLSILKF